MSLRARIPPPARSTLHPFAPQENLHETPVYGGWVDAKGPRYCPSIEDKIVRFADKESHQVGVAAGWAAGRMACCPKSRCLWLASSCALSASELMSACLPALPLLPCPADLP